MREVAIDRAYATDLAITRGLRGGHADALPVNVQAHKRGARFIHGPSPRKLATPRQPYPPGASV